MKTSKLLPHSIALTLLAISAVSPSALAATMDWTGTTSATWATSTNWFSGTAPANSLTTDMARFNQATYTFQPTATSGGSIAGLIFGSSSGAVTLTTANNAARLNIGSSGISMDSGAGAVILGINSNQGLQLGASQLWANNSSNLLTVSSLSGQTAGQNYTLTLTGSGGGGTAITGIIRNDYLEVNTGTLSLVINTTGGVTTLSGANTFTGDTTLTTGVLALNNTNALQRSALNTAGTGTVTTSVATLALGGLKGSRDLSSVITSGYSSVTALTLNPQSGTSTYTGIISNGAATTSLTKAGAGTQVLEGANTYTGVTNINAGVLGVTSLSNASTASTLGASGTAATNLVINGGTLRLTGTSTGAQSTNRLFTTGTASATIDSSAGVGSSMNFTNTGTITAVNSIGHRTLTLTGSRNGTLASVIGERNNTDSTTSVVKNGNGTWTVSSNNAYSGSTTINAGTLLLNGSVGGSGVTVNNGGSLAGSGTTSSLVTVMSGGTLTPGNSPGVITHSAGLTMETGSDFTFELIEDTVSGRGTNYDGVNVTGGTFTLQTGVDFNIVMNLPGSTTNYNDIFWDSNQSWLVFDNANTPTISALFNLGTVSNDILGNSFSVTGGSFGFSLSGNDVMLNYTAVPEPSTWALAAFSLTTLMVLRRRRR